MIDNSVKRYPRSLTEAFGGADPGVLTHPLNGPLPTKIRLEEKIIQVWRKAKRQVIGAAKRSVVIIAGH